MAINYEQVGWDTSKYVNPTRMNHMDDGIKAACDKVDEHDQQIETINSNFNGLNTNQFRRLIVTGTSSLNVFYDVLNNLGEMTDDTFFTGLHIFGGTRAFIGYVYKTKDYGTCMIFDNGSITVHYLQDNIITKREIDKI